MHEPHNDQLHIVGAVEGLLSCDGPCIDGVDVFAAILLGGHFIGRGRWGETDRVGKSDTPHYSETIYLIELWLES